MRINALFVNGWTPPFGHSRIGLEWIMGVKWYRLTTYIRDFGTLFNNWGVQFNWMVGIVSGFSIG